MSKIINPADDQKRQAALETPHGLFVADEILEVKMDAFWGGFSLGLRNPAGTIAPAFTVKLPLPKALELAKQITDLATKNKAAIVAAQSEVQKSIG